MINKLFKNYFLSLFVILGAEIIFRLLSPDTIFFDWAFLRIVVGSNITALIIGIILSFAKEIVAKIVILILTFAFSFYAVMQLGFLNFLGVYISFGTSSQLGAVKDYIGDYINSFNMNFILIFIPYLILVLYYIFIDPNLYRVKKVSKNKNAKSKYEKIIASKCTKLGRGIAIVTTLILALSYYITLTVNFMQNKLQLRTNVALFRNPSIPTTAVNQFGITTFAFLDIKTTILPVSESDIEEDDFEKPDQTITDNSRTFDDSAWEDLITNETNSNLNKLNNYFLSRNIADKNEYTGYFEGKNLVVVMMESVNTLIINKELYPTIYKMYNEGWAWDNAYSPRNACSTGNNEMTSVLSLFTINNSCTANRYKNNTYFNSLYNLFNSSGYKTTSYHDFNDTYYYRNEIHPNWGSSFYYDMYDLGIKNSGVYADWPSDIEFMEKAVPKYINQEKFMSYMITVSPHHPYGSSSTAGDKYASLYSGIPGITSSLKRYMSKLKHVDLALESLLAQLEEAGKLEDTVIVLFADHYPYGFKTNELQKLFDYDLSERKEIDRTPFIIYNPKLTPTKFEDYTTFMNITPTLANLFNLEYDPRLYAGEDLFDQNADKLAIFADGSWQNEIAYYEATTGKVTYMSDITYTDEEIMEINKRISNKIKMSNQAIQLNYFAYLEKKLPKHTQTNYETDSPANGS